MTNHLLKKILLSLLLLTPLLLLFSPRSFLQDKKGFSLKEISAALPFHPEWEISALDEEKTQEVQQALMQPYRYLGSGGQCFTFVSLDEKYVIKFFKQKKFAIPVWIEHFPIPFLVDWLRKKKAMKLEAKRSKVFSAFRLAFDLVPIETGLLYVHLNPTEHLKKILKLCDAQSNTHFLNLDELEFVLQRKAELAYSALDSLMANQELDGAKLAIEQLLALNVTLYKKGLRNRDTNFRSNCGFICSKAALIDVGRVVYSDEIKKSENYKRELAQITPAFRHYLATRHPQLVGHFDQSVDKIMQSDP